MPLPDTLTREHVEQAIAQLDEGTHITSERCR
jgi:hypothetical protein